MDIKPTDFGMWRHHPVTEIVLRYLKDKREFIKEQVFQQWVDGSMTMATEQTIRGQIIELFEMENLQFDAIEAFYETEDTEVESS